LVQFLLNVKSGCLFSRFEVCHERFFKAAGVRGKRVSGHGGGGAGGGRGRAGGPGVLAFQGLEGGALRVRLDADANQLRYTLHLGETANGRVERARLVVTGLADEAGEQVSELRVVGGEELALPVEPARSVQLLLEADIPAPGTYHATLTLLQEGALPTSIPLRVSRPRPVLNVALDVAPVRGQLPLFRAEGRPRSSSRSRRRRGGR
jgi:hypothetical protein